MSDKEEMTEAAFVESFVNHMVLVMGYQIKEILQ